MQRNAKTIDALNTLSNEGRDEDEVRMTDAAEAHFVITRPINPTDGCSPPKNRNKRGGNYRSKRSADFISELQNAKQSPKTWTIINMTDENQFSKRFVVRSRTRSTTKLNQVQICMSPNCDCEFFGLKNTPCKHMMFVLMDVLGIKEENSLLQQVYYTQDEIACLFSSTPSRKEALSCSVPKSSNSAVLTPKALQQTTSTKLPTINPTAYLPYRNVLPPKPDLPEPQNDPYWLMKKVGSIKRCNGCKNDLDSEFIIGRIEIDYLPDVNHSKGGKRWAASTGPKYYHVSLTCLRNRRPSLSLTIGDIKVAEGCEMTDDIKSSLDV